MFGATDAAYSRRQIAERRTWVTLQNGSSAQFLQNTSKVQQIRWHKQEEQLGSTSLTGLMDVDLVEYIGLGKKDFATCFNGALRNFSPTGFMTSPPQRWMSCSCMSTREGRWQAGILKSGIITHTTTCKQTGKGCENQSSNQQKDIIA